MWNFSKVPTSQHYHYSPPFLQKLLQDFHSTLLLSTIYQGLLILLLPKKVVGTSLFKTWVENNVWKREASNDLNHLLKKKKKEVKVDPKLSGQWNVLSLVANRKRKRSFQCLETNGRKRWNFLWSSFHFPPKQLT